MTQTIQSSFGPEFTPSPIKTLIAVTGFLSVFCALFNNLFHHYFGITGPQDWLVLSWYGLSNYYIWQPITFMFVFPSGSFGISFYFLIMLTFSMYILWIIGTSVFERVGKNPFLRLYFISGIAAGVFTLLMMSLTSYYTPIAGPGPAILALLIVWAMLYPDVQILLFFVIPVKAKWLVVGILGAILLSHLSQGDFVGLVFYLTGPIIGYLYAAIAWGLQSPFDVTHPIDQRLSRLRSYYPFKEDISSKIIDFKTGRTVLDDERFMDAMLSKISKKGEDSLTWRERRRMRKISEKKMKR